MRTGVLLCVATLLAVGLAGCTNGGSFDANREFKETGKTVHLKMSVKDFVDHEVYPGFKANLWAFCVEPFDPSDTYSAAAVEYRDPLPTDGKIDSVDGPQRRECGVPAPTIRVTQGDRVIVDFVNGHFHPHTIHWHGQFVPWDQDGAPGVSQDSVRSGGSITYDFIAKRAGTLWYHCHVDTQLHVMRGLYGAFIVEPQDGSQEPKDIDKEYILMLGTLTRNLVEARPGAGAHNHTGDCFSGKPGCVNPKWDVTPDTWLINGRSYPHTMHDPWSTIEVEEGERVRIRFINVGETVETMHPHGHDMYVTHRDGNPLPEGARFWVDTLSIGPAERYDVVLEANNPGPWMFHTHVNSHETNCGRAPGGMHTMILYDGHAPHQFEAELPGTCPYQAQPFGLASDADFSESMRLEAGASVPNLQEFDITREVFEVVQQCSIQAVRVDARFDPDNSALAPFTDLALRIHHPENGTLATIDLVGEASTASWDMDVKEAYTLLKHLESGYLVHVTGTSVQGTLTIEARVLYEDSLLATRQAHELFGVPSCPGAERA